MKFADVEISVSGFVELLVFYYFIDPFFSQRLLFWQMKEQYIFVSNAAVVYTVFYIAISHFFSSTQLNDSTQFFFERLTILTNHWYMGSLVRWRHQQTHQNVYNVLDVFDYKGMDYALYFQS